MDFPSIVNFLWTSMWDYWYISWPIIIVIGLMINHGERLQRREDIEIALNNHKNIK